MTTTGAGETTIATTEDTTDEADGSITITLNPGKLNPSNKNYRRPSDSTTQFQRTINVTDNDTPEVSISRTGGAITEGDTGETNVQFTISATPPPHKTITVNLTLVETGDVLSGATNKMKEIRVMMDDFGDGK